MTFTLFILLYLRIELDLYPYGGQIIEVKMGCLSSSDGENEICIPSSDEETSLKTTTSVQWLIDW